MLILERLERDLARQYYGSLIGREVEVLVEGQVSARTGWLHGTDRRYVPVEIPGESGDVGRMISGLATRATRHCLEAEREIDDGCSQ
jgi:threonylcarbamoyladenosine tRNA methylthiotransferase MtaB